MRGGHRYPALTTEQLSEAFREHASGLEWGVVAVKFGTRRHALCRQLRAAGYVLTKNSTGFAKGVRTAPKIYSADAVAMRGFNQLSQDYLMRKLG